MGLLPSVGSLINGRYVLKQEIGRGAMGTVWLASDSRNGRDVALKHVNTGLDLVSRLRREIKAMSRIHHENVVRLYEMIMVDQEPWIVMKYYVGARTLTNYLAQAHNLEPLSQEEIAWIGHQVVDALVALHAKKIIHRDIKPDNILILPNGHVVVIDLGISKVLDETALTHVEGLVGTPAYASPEQMLNQDVSSATDVYGLGASLYQLAEGHRPFKGNNMGQLALNIINGEMTPMSRNDEIARIIHWMMATDPSRRPTLDDLLREFVALESATMLASGETPMAATRVANRMATAFPGITDLVAAYEQPKAKLSLHPKALLWHWRSFPAIARLTFVLAMVVGLLVIPPVQNGIGQVMAMRVTEVHDMTVKGKKFQVYRQYNKNYYRDDQVVMVVPFGWQASGWRMLTRGNRLLIVTRIEAKTLDQALTTLLKNNPQLRKKFRQMKSPPDTRQWLYRPVAKRQGVAMIYRRDNQFYSVAIRAPRITKNELTSLEAVRQSVEAR